MPAQVLDVLEANDPFAHVQKRTRQPAFRALTLEATVLPGVQESRAHYVHGVRFINANSGALDEIARFVHAVRLSRRRLAI